jgi:hypothetical protein
MRNQSYKTNSVELRRTDLTLHKFIQMRIARQLPCLSRFGTSRWSKNDHRRARTCNLLMDTSRSQTRYHFARRPRRISALIVGIHSQAKYPSGSIPVITKAATCRVQMCHIFYVLLTRSEALPILRDVGKVISRSIHLYRTTSELCRATVFGIRRIKPILNSTFPNLTAGHCKPFLSAGWVALVYTQFG